MNEQSLFHKIHQDEAPDKLSLIIEISKGDHNKYEFNHELGILELDRVLHGPLFYPINYCDAPGTWNDGDNDPLDALLFNSSPLAPGTLAIGRVVGMMEMIDNGELDNKIICVSDRDPRYDHVTDINDFTPHELKDLKTFFELYKIPQTGRDSVKVGEFLDKAAAAEFIITCTAAYRKKFAAK
jgi:inorganic pyrophosphatase